MVIFGSNNAIGGLTSDARNVISGNGSTGIQMFGTSTTGNIVQGNFIGTDVSGTVAVANSGPGVLILSPGNTIGGTTPQARNIISGSASDGVTISGNDSTGNQLLGNFIGVDVSGTRALGNSQVGVFIDSSSNIIGGTTPGAGNTIAFNGRFGGVFVVSGTGNFIRGNSIFSNSGLGIDLSPGSVTANDPGDADLGPNNLQNFPVLTTASSTGGTTTIQGTLNSIANTTFTIDFYSNTSCDPSGFGEGQTFIGSTLVTTDGSGNASFSAAFPITIPSGQSITATATDPNNNTSEFSQCAAVNVADLSLTMSAFPDPVDLGSNLTYTIQVKNNGPLTATGVILTDTLPASVVLLSATSTQGTCTGAGTITCSIGTLANGATATSTIVGTPTTPGRITNTARVTSNEADPNAANNAALQSTIVRGTFVVNSTGEGGDNDLSDGLCNDGSGNCTLRAAIQQANALPGTDTIHFSIGTGVQTIAPLSPLPTITDPVVIDGTTQPGFAGSPIIELNGASAGFASGLDIEAGSSTVRGLVINRFSGRGIDLLIRGGNVIKGNFIGTNVAGTARLRNGAGIIIFGSSTNNTIGGTTPEARNIISGNGDGIEMFGVSGNVVQGNLIGTDATGTIRLGNSTGILIFSAPNNVIGGPASGARNTISSNGTGISILGGAAVGNLIQDNFIGTNSSGTGALGNGGDGLNSNAPVNVIGNVISANFGDGIEISTGGTASFVQRSVVQGNFIGTNVAGVNLGNRNRGIQIDADNTFIGGVAANQANAVAFNTIAGVSVGSGVGNSIRGNSVFSNGGLGIDLAPFGLNQNDPGDADLGANNLQNFPVLTSVISSGGNTSVQGTLNSAANTMFTIDFYLNSSCDPSGFGEGQTFIGSTTVTTDVSGDASFELTFAVAVPTGQSVTATATDPTNNTSEFSQCLPVNSSITPVGTNVSVKVGLVTVIFTGVTASGTTSVTPMDPNSAGTLPGGFALVDNLAFEVSSTATVTPPITICFTVSSVNDPVIFSSLRVLHNEGGVLVDRTVLPPDSPVPDFATRTICARVSSLSPFVIVRLLNRPPVAKCKNIEREVGDACAVSIRPSDVDGGSFDADPGDTITLTLDSTGPFGLGERTVTLTATDSHGATSSCAATLRVVDRTPPKISCPAPITIEFASDEGAVVTYAPASTDNCAGAILLTSTPASGSTFAIGTTSVVSSATDASGNTASCTFTVTVLGPRGVKQNVLNELTTLRGTVTDKQDGEKLDEAIKHLARSLDVSLWIDQTRLQPKEGEKVFNEEKDAVSKLAELLKGKKTAIPDTVIQGFINRIVRSDRELGLVAVKDAAVVGGNPDDIAKAKEELAKGDADIAAGKFESGIEHYRNAWQKAVKAAEKK